MANPDSHLPHPGPPWPVHRYTPPTLKSAIPVISVSDSHRAEAYYCTVLGFTKLFAYRPNPSKAEPCYLGVARDSVTLHLHSFRPARAGLTDAFLYVTDVDQLFAEFSARGAICHMPPTDQTWGNRELAIRDPGMSSSSPRR